jgi:putative glutamine amidotransferase
VCAVRERARWSFWDQEAALVPVSYLAAIEEAGGVALALPPTPHLSADVERVLDVLDGVLVIGGADIDPRFYGQEREAATEAVYPERDAFELAVVEKALELDRPFLGICRGLQVLNVARGGTLKQDIADETGSTLHRRRLGSFEGTEHVVQISEGSLAHRAIGELETVARCHHHQAIDEVGNGLVVSARAVADGMVEAVEVPENRFALAVQWHPEADRASRVIASMVEASLAATA